MGAEWTQNGLGSQLPIDNLGVWLDSGAGRAFFGHNSVWVVRRDAFAVYERSISLLSPLLSNVADRLKSEPQMTRTSLNL